MTTQSNIQPLHVLDAVGASIAQDGRRVHHYIDIENLVGGSERCTPELVRSARAQYEAVTGLRETDLITLACGKRAAGRGTLFEFCKSRGRRLVGTGVDAADKLLLDAIGEQDVRKGDVVVIASGDGEAFSDIAAALVGLEAEVFVVSSRSALSLKLRFAVGPANIIYFDFPESLPTLRPAA